MTRPYSDGSVYKDSARGRWIGIFDTGRDSSGKRIRRKVSGRTATEARRKLRELQREVAAGRPAGDGSLRLGPYLDRWMAQAIEPGAFSPNTIDNYRWVIDHHLKPALGARRIRDLTPDDVDALLHHMAAVGYHRSTLKLVRGVLARALRQGERFGHVGRNVALLVDLPNAPTRKSRSLSIDEAHVLLEEAQGERLEAAITMGLMLGLRPGELLGLEWQDVDLEEARVCVRRSLKRERGALVIGPPKTLSSVRTLDVPPVVVAALRSHRAVQGKERLVAGQAWIPNDLVFASTVGTPIDPSNLRRALARITERAGLGRWRPHELRHSAASILSAAGVQLEAVADVLGHADSRTTATIYRHRIVESVPAAVGPMQELFGTTS